MKRIPKWNLFINFMSKRKIRNQLYSVYFIAMVIPILVVGIVLTLNNYRMLTEYHKDLLNADNVRIKNLLFEFTAQVKNYSENIISDEAIRTTLDTEYESTENFRRNVDKISLLDGYRNSYLEISDAYIYCDNPTLVSYKQFQNVTDEIKEQDWYQRALQQSAAFWTSIPKENASGIPYYQLSLIRQVPLWDSDYNAVLVVRVSDDYLRSCIENTSYYTYLSVGTEDIFYSSKRSEAGSPMPVEIDYNQNYFSFTGDIALEDRKCLTTVSTLNTYQTTSKIYICTINRDAHYEILEIVQLCLAIIGFSILIPGVLIFFFAHYVSARMNLLRQEMHKASQQDYELISEIRGKDEISQVYSDLQVMVEKIKENEAEIYEAKIKDQILESKQLEIDYKMLASQINPHFLYNTLETIRMKAFTAGDKEVAGAIKLLGKSMRYVLENTGTERSTLAKELEHVEAYLQIQKLRFEDRFDAKVIMGEGVNPEEITLLPLLLQPVVENSMVHGLEGIEIGGLIQIDIYLGNTPHVSDLDGEEKEALSEKERMLYIDITDNGEGMDAENLENLQRAIQTKDMGRTQSIGLYNINQRLKLLYGEEYALRIDSKTGRGTRVRLRIPAKQCINYNEQ